MKSLLFVCLQLVLYGTAVSVIREYFYNSQQTDITTAENYCRVNHGHLAHITTEKEFQKALLSSLPPSWAWIGLKRTAPHENIWKWSNGKITNFTKWHSGEPNDIKSPGEDCVVMDMNGWYDTSCVSGTFNSICSKNFTLVKEKKTWEEALQHCSTHYTDLAFVNTEQLGYFSTHLNIENQTVSVWTGLRFLDGKWFWVNGVPMGSLVSLPQCPIRPYHCGSYTFNKNIWENRECNEKLHFLCYD